MRFRPAVKDDLDRLLGCVVDESISWAHPDRLLSCLDSGNYRYDRVWLATDDDTGDILARAVWWGFPDGGRPLALDCVYVHPSARDRVSLAAELLNHAHAAFGRAPEYHVFVLQGWRDDPEATAAIGWRWQAAGRAGLTQELERLRYAWTAGDAPVPEPSQRLVFRGEEDDEVFVEAFRRVAVGTLDFATRQALRTMDPVEQAREEVRDYMSMPGERSWWRLAYDRSGDLVGFALPSANDGGPVVGYLGVVPEHRGHGYVDDLLAEITRFHAERGVQRIVADTDAGNAPMARAFDRAGYRTFAVRLVLSADPDVP
ncbi:GNAT family N-acetyltransferase [Nonomuraea sp. KC401]|uniref:GNAT family N-acetyltransferase n=1 Tax=unclassified Nonomuraea TaxID=2593643 RepID=UPI0010FE61BB|nr:MULTISPECIES: GNAT family N-acetyltransferase [unclassified Nonomuraea]NBE99728.1 GNAT family N-acetyltransferase [Nonomuraea sp. K271]TLF71379.1 GNAT family N-acetyltransferase [Nonomuraea sp. KC401]